MQQLKPQLGGVQLVISDVDDTLVSAKDSAFYRQYRICVEKAIAIYFEVSGSKAKEIATAYRQAGGGAQQALFTGSAGSSFADISARKPDYGLLHGIMSELDPDGKFESRLATQHLIHDLRRVGVSIVALTNSPTSLIKKTLIASGYSLDDFSAIVGYEANELPPKFNPASGVFIEIAQNAGVAMSDVVAVGDKAEYDVLPAVQDGAIGCIVGGIRGQDADDNLTHYDSVDDLFRAILRAKEGV